MSQSTVKDSLHSVRYSQSKLWAVLLVSVLVHAVAIFLWPTRELLITSFEPELLSISIESGPVKSEQTDSFSQSFEPEPVAETESKPEQLNEPAALIPPEQVQPELAQPTAVTSDELSNFRLVDESNEQVQSQATISEATISDATVAEQVPISPEMQIDQTSELADSPDRIIDNPIDTSSSDSKTDATLVNNSSAMQPQMEAVVSDDVAEPNQQNAVPPSRDSEYVQARFKDGAPTIEKPELAAKRRWKGIVILRGRVGLEGELDRLSVYQSSGYDILDEAAVAQAQQWLFEPAMVEQTAIVHWVQIPVVFR